MKNLLTKTGLRDGVEVEITFNEKQTHCYIDGKRIPCNDAKEMVEKYEEMVEVRKSIKTPNVYNMSPSEIIRIVSQNASINGKLITLDKAINGDIVPDDVVETLKLILLLNRKSSIATGFSFKVAKKFILEMGEEKAIGNKTNPNRIAEIVKKVTENGKRFSLNKEEIASIVESISSEDMEVVCNAIGKKIKMGISDKLISERLGL